MGNKQTILLVDDVKENIDILMELLQSYDLIPALDAQNAIDIAMQEDEIDLILLDIMMPDMDGYQVCKILKENPKTTHIPIIFLSAKDKLEDINRGFEAGGVDYITKPFYPDELLSRVNTHLKLRAYEKNLEKKVQQEIQKNIKKERIIFQKSKQSALSELLMHIANQWKQPLTSLHEINMLNKAKLEAADAQKNQDIIQSIEKSQDIISFMSETIDIFINFYKPSHECKRFSITASIIDILTIVEGTFYLDDIKIYIISHENEDALGDTTEFSQAILSILNNARDIFKIRNIKNPEIHIAVENQKITISDNAGGIEQSPIEDIFLPSIGKNNGMGIGLYVAKVLIEKNNGVISVENTKDGAKFTIEFITFIED